MTDQEQAEIIGKNLKRLMEGSGKSQLEVATAIGVAQQTFSKWFTGQSIPRSSKIYALANYFGVTFQSIVCEYYPEDEVKQVAQEIVDNHDLKVLFDAARTCTSEELQLVYQMMKKFK